MTRTIKTDWQPICWVCTTGADEVRMQLMRGFHATDRAIAGDYRWVCTRCCNSVPFEELPRPEQDPISGKPLQRMVADEPRRGPSAMEQSGVRQVAANLLDRLNATVRDALQLHGINASTGWLDTADNLYAAYSQLLDELANEWAAAKCDRCQEVFPGSELQAVDPDGHGEAELCGKCLERMEQERAEETLIASCPDCGEIHPGPACHADDPDYRRV